MEEEKRQAIKELNEAKRRYEGESERLIALESELNKLKEKFNNTEIQKKDDSLVK